MKPIALPTTAATAASVAPPRPTALATAAPAALAPIAPGDKMPILPMVPVAEQEQANYHHVDYGMTIGVACPLELELRPLLPGAVGTAAQCSLQPVCVTRCCAKRG